MALGLALLGGCQQAPNIEPGLFDQPDGAFDYRWTDPYVATVVRTPPDQRAPLPVDYPRRDLRFVVYPDRPIPEVLWFHPSYRASLARQPGRAPLVFVIAGTGAGHDTSYMRTLEQIFYAAGFHVLSLSSPSHPNFIVTAAETSVPGYIEQDVEDLYRIMRIAYERVRPDIEIESVNLAGYSLGGWQAAFVAQRDAEDGVFGFRRTLLINPPVDLYRSMNRLEALLEDNIPGGIDGVPAFMRRVFDAVSRLFEGGARLSFDEDFLYQAYRALEPTDQDLAALIGISFRLASANMAFSSDAIVRTGYLVQPDAVLTSQTPLTRYFRASLRQSFEDYLREMLIPFERRRDPDLTQEAIIAASTLKRIEPFLANAPNVGLVTAADDIILDPGDISYLREVFGDRAAIFPHGGHCGNFQHPHVVAAIGGFLIGEGEQP